MQTPEHDYDTRDPNRQRDGSFTTHPFHEGKSEGHTHRVVALGGLEVLVLRDEGAYASIESRGPAVVDRLEEALAAGPGRVSALRAASGMHVVFDPRQTTGINS